MTDIPNKENIWSSKITEQNIEDYLNEIYMSRINDRQTHFVFISDEDGNSLGRDMFHKMLEQAAKEYFTKAEDESK